MTRLYTKTHEWLMREDDHHYVLGISHFAQEQIGDVIFVELPAVGDLITADSPFAVIESVKAANEIFAPVNARISEVNPNLENEPNLINTQPEQDGWLVKIETEHPINPQQFMNEEQYQSFSQTS